MSRALLKSIQQQTDTRLILPFGTSARIGDVVRLGRDGGFSIEGSTKSILGMARPTAQDIRAGGEVNQTYQSAKGVKFEFRLAGKASTLFPQLPSASAGFDIEFASADAWILALTGRTLLSFTEENRFRQPILDPNKRRLVGGLIRLRNPSGLWDRDGDSGICGIFCGAHPHLYGGDSSAAGSVASPRTDACPDRTGNQQPVRIRCCATKPRRESPGAWWLGRTDASHHVGAASPRQALSAASACVPVERRQPSKSDPRQKTAR